MAAQDLIREAQDPSTSAARLAELVQADRATWPSVAAHPAAYDGLLQWLSERGDAATNVVLSARATNLSAAAVPPPAAPVAPVAPVAPAAESPVEAAPVESTPAASAPVESPTVEAPAAQTPADEPEAVTETIEPAQHEPTVVAPFEPLEQPAPTAQTAPIGQTAPATQSTPSWAPVAAAAPAYASTDASGAGTGHTGNTGGSDDKSKRNIWVLAALVAAVLVLIGGVAFGATKVFGGDDDKEETSSSQSRSDDSTPSDDETDAPTPDDESGGLASGSGDDPEFCTAMTDLQEISTDALADSGTPDLDDLKEMATEMRAGYDKVQAAAPADLKDEIDVMVDYLDLMENPSAAASEDFGDKIKEYSDASMKVSQYYAKSCF